MKNKNKWLFFCFFCLMVSCKKYDNGPLLSFVSVENRVEGHYEVESATENGLDQMNHVDSLNLISLKFSLLTPDYGGSDHTFSATLIDSNYHPSEWWFYDDKNEIIVHHVGCYGTPPAPVAPLPGFLTNGTCDTPAVYWEILKLSNKRMWLKTVFLGNEYEVHLKKL